MLAATAADLDGVRGGVFWQTQGTGKGFSMVFFAQKVQRKVAGHRTFVVVTGRVELDDRIAKTFKLASAVSEAAGDPGHATSGAHLRELFTAFPVRSPVLRKKEGGGPMTAASAKTSG